MARLVPIPADAKESALTLDPQRPFVLAARAGGPASCVIACAGRRWVLYDVSGATRVAAQPVRGGAATLEDGALISAAGRRLRFERGCGPAWAVRAGRRSVCAYCRDELLAGEACSRCPACGREQHDACVEVSGRCGRCGQELKP